MHRTKPGSIAMDPQLFELVEPVVVFTTMLGVAFGVKLLVWGKGPIRRKHLPPTDPDLAQRVTELEERAADLTVLVDQQATQLEEVHERLDFTERMLARRAGPDRAALDSPRSATPV